MLCDDCELTSICKLFGFAKGEGLLSAISISECQYYLGPKGTEDHRPPQVSKTRGRPRGRFEHQKGPDRPYQEKKTDKRKEQKEQRREGLEGRDARLVERDYTNLILANSDLEGIIGAAAIVYENGLENYRIYFTQPGRLEESTGQLHSALLRVFICGLGVDERKPSLTSKFISALQDFDFTWFDHHKGWTDFLEQQFVDLPASDFGELGFQFDEQATNSVELISNDVLLNGLLEGEDSSTEQQEMNRMFQAALDAAPSDHSTRYDIVNYLLQFLNQGQEAGERSRELNRLRAKAEKYHRLQPLQRSVVEQGKIIGDVLVMRQPSGVWINYRDIFEQALGQAQHAILLAEREGNLTCRECGASFRKPSRFGDCPRCHADSFEVGIAYSTLVTTTSDMDLGQLFECRNGKPHRVTLVGDEVERALKILNQQTLETTEESMETTEELVETTTEAIEIAEDPGDPSKEVPGDGEMTIETTESSTKSQKPGELSATPNDEILSDRHPQSEEVTLAEGTDENLETNE